jgi:hypothetical protein
MVGSQTANLIPDPSFAHNLCFRCPNGSCEPTVEIYVPRTFQWYKKLPNPMSFDPFNRFLGIHRDSNSQNGSSLRSESVHSHALTHSQASFLAHALASPCLHREPKARVATIKLCWSVVCLPISRCVIVPK